MIDTRRERILVTVKTYPTLSTRYGETVCTAGVREDGSWIRLYPVPFRRLEETQQYSKFDWINCSVIKQDKDSRPESYRPTDTSELVSQASIGTTDKWRERRRIILENGRVYNRLEEVIKAAKDNELSLCVFKPTEIVDLVVEPDERDWDPKKLAAMRDISAQPDMFEDNSWRRTFQVIPKLPYVFSYRFKDADGTESKLRIIDWEIGALYRNCLGPERDEQLACQKVRQKYFDTFINTDLHFFLGTTQQWHYVGRNPYLIIGVFPIPHDQRIPLF